MNIMEHLNEVHLIGTVGAVRTNKVANKILTRLSVATNYAYCGSENGSPIIEVTWHNVAWWGDAGLNKGDRVEVLGRLRNQRYVGQDGEERYAEYIHAQSVVKLD